MEQRSDVEFRAEKLYKNTREKFRYLIREVVSNSIHAVLIKKSLLGHNDFKPCVEFKVKIGESRITLEVSDNGDGFNDLNRIYFTSLDSRNVEKEKLHFHPKGQGRLAVVYFSDSATYSSTHFNALGELNSLSFDYPESSQQLFDLNSLDVSSVSGCDTGAILRLQIWKHQSLARANTFFNKYSDVDKLAKWFIDTFFPFFMENETLNLKIDFDSTIESINKGFIEKNVKQVPFFVKLDESTTEDTPFHLWLVEAATTTTKSRNQVACFARHLRAEIEGGKLEYEIDLPTLYDRKLTSEFFDDNVDQKGDKIEITSSDTEKIQAALNEALDAEFSSQISANREESDKNIKRAMEKFHSLAVFIDRKQNTEIRKILKETDIVKNAIDEKGRVERAYWASDEPDPEEVGRLLNSSLQIYINHRGRVLNRLQELIFRYDKEGEVKNELEDDVHDLFLRRGNKLVDSSGKSHLHNLWILDDKYTIFSETFQAASTKRGQAASDIYIWADDLEKTRELLILELKSTTASHNAGDKYEGMVAQVKRYAGEFYRNPVKVINWAVDPRNILYSGVVLARKSDINRELNSNNSGANPEKIPFLESSYYFNEKFSVSESAIAEPNFVTIRIEMYSYEDIYGLAKSRNAVFLKLLKNEFRVDSEV
jgi:hypothetical protein